MPTSQKCSKCKKTVKWVHRCYDADCDFEEWCNTCINAEGQAGAPDFDTWVRRAFIPAQVDHSTVRFDLEGHC